MSTSVWLFKPRSHGRKSRHPTTDRFSTCQHATRHSHERSTAPKQHERTAWTSARRFRSRSFRRCFTSSARRSTRRSRSRGRACALVPSPSPSLVQVETAAAAARMFYPSPANIPVAAAAAARAASASAAAAAPTPHKHRRGNTERTLTAAAGHSLLATPIATPLQCGRPKRPGLLFNFSLSEYSKTTRPTASKHSSSTYESIRAAVSGAILTLSLKSSPCERRSIGGAGGATTPVARVRSRSTSHGGSSNQQKELDSGLVVGSSHPSASARKCRGAPFFAPCSRVFLKKNKPGRFLTFSWRFQKFLQALVI